MPTMRELLRNAERRHTRATIQDVCINYIRGLCQRASRCSRIHPVDKTPFLEILHKRPRNRNPAHQMYSNDPWRDHAHSVEPSVSLMESPQSFFEDLTDQELRGGDAPSKHDTSTGSWDAQTGCWVMPCHAEIWESDSRVQGIFENRRKIQEGCFFEEEGGEDSFDKTLSFIEKWLRNVQDSLNIIPQTRNVESGKARAGKRPGPPCDPNRCTLWLKENCAQGEECRYLPGNLKHETDGPIQCSSDKLEQDLQASVP